MQAILQRQSKPPPWTPLLVALVIPLLLIAFLRLLTSSTKRNGPYFPGPKPKPFVGNMMDFPTKNPAQEYSKWRKRYNSA